MALFKSCVVMDNNNNSIFGQTRQLCTTCTMPHALKMSIYFLLNIISRKKITALHFFKSVFLFCYTYLLFCLQIDFEWMCFSFFYNLRWPEFSFRPATHLIHTQTQCTREIIKRSKSSNSGNGCAPGLWPCLERNVTGQACTSRCFIEGY